MFDKWMIDASMSRDGMLCFCPVELDEAGEVTNFVVGMNFISDKPPQGGECIGIFHPDGQQAADEWYDANKDSLPK